MIAVRLIGGLLTIVAASALGFHVAANLERRPREIAELCASLALLETEISYSATPLAEALGAVAGRCGRPARGLMEAARRRLVAGHGAPAAGAWTEAVFEVYDSTALRPPDRDILIGFGSSLGASDREDQVKHIRLAVERLRRAKAEAKAEAARLAGLWRNMGVLGGVLVVIVLL